MRVGCRPYCWRVMIHVSPFSSEYGAFRRSVSELDDFDTTKIRGLGGAVQRPAHEVVDRAMPWLETVTARRFFA